MLVVHHQNLPEIYSLLKQIKRKDAIIVSRPLTKFEEYIDETEKERRERGRARKRERDGQTKKEEEEREKKESKGQAETD